MMTRWAKLFDDRGFPSEICTIQDAVAESGYAKGFLVNRDETGRFWAAFFIIGFLFACVMQVIFLIIGISTLGQVFSSLGAAVFFGSALLFGGAFGVLIKLYGWRSSRHARQAMLRARLCPGCAYLIEDLQPEPDGCTVCPECGGAWKLSDG